MLKQKVACLLAAGVFGYSLGSFGNGVFSQFSGKEESDSCLNFSGGNGRPLVVVSKSGCFSGDSLKDIVHEAVHDAHGLAGNTSVRVHLFQDFVDVDSVGFPPLPLLFLVPSALGLRLSGCLLSSFTSNLWWHVYPLRAERQMIRDIGLKNLFISEGGIENSTVSADVKYSPKSEV